MWASGTGDAALVEVVDRGRCADCVVPRVNRGAACAQRHRMGGAAIILQGTELGVSIDARAGGIGIAEIPAAIGDGAGAVVSRWAVGDNRVLQRDRPSKLLMPPPETVPLLPENVLLLTVSLLRLGCPAAVGAIAGEAAVAYGHRAG